MKTCPCCGQPAPQTTDRILAASDTIVEALTYGGVRYVFDPPAKVEAGKLYALDPTRPALVALRE